MITLLVTAVRLPITFPVLRATLFAKMTAITFALATSIGEDFGRGRLTTSFPSPFHVRTYFFAKSNARLALVLRKCRVWSALVVVVARNTTGNARVMSLFDKRPTAAVAVV